MAESSTKVESPVSLQYPPDNVSAGRWFAFYALCLVGAGAALAVLISRQEWSWQAWRDDFWGQLAATSPAVKLIIFGVYISLCCTFLPMNTSAVVAAVAMQDTAVCSGATATTLVVAAVGGIASCIANLNDYHLFTLLLRHHKLARVRNTRLYNALASWFAKSPFAILVIFNITPIPIAIIRILATIYRYPRTRFALANFIGRFIRYGLIAYVTYRLGKQGWIAPVSLLGLAAILAAAKIISSALRKLHARRSARLLSRAAGQE